MHPDRGGDAAQFERLKEAEMMLRSPARRLRHWLELEGIEGGLRGALSSDLIEIFEQVGPELQEADALLREREAASSKLVLAVLEGRVIRLREGLEGLQERLAGEVEKRVQSFERIEAGEIDGWEVARDLAFLEKWQGQVRERFAALW